MNQNLTYFGEMSAQAMANPWAEQFMKDVHALSKETDGSQLWEETDGKFIKLFNRTQQRQEFLKMDPKVIKQAFLFKHADGDEGSADNLCGTMVGVHVEIFLLRCCLRQRCEVQ